MLESYVVGSGGQCRFKWKEEWPLMGKIENVDIESADTVGAAGANRRNSIASGPGGKRLAAGASARTTGECGSQDGAGLDLGWTASCCGTEGRQRRQKSRF